MKSFQESAFFVEWKSLQTKSKYAKVWTKTVLDRKEDGVFWMSKMKVYGFDDLDFAIEIAKREAKLWPLRKYRIVQRTISCVINEIKGLDLNPNS